MPEVMCQYESERNMHGITAVVCSIIMLLIHYFNGSVKLAFIFVK